MRNYHCFFVWLLITISVLGCGDDSTVHPNMEPIENITQVEASPLPGKIAFASNRDGDFEIYTINADGSSLVQLTANKGRDFPSSWSPDGQKLAFTSDRAGNYDIYVVEVGDSNSTRQLTHNLAADAAPLWSPYGERIAFTSMRDGDSEIFVMNVDGENLIQLTHNDVNDLASSWSPDGQRIAFARYPKSVFDPDSEVFVMDADGKNVMQLTNNETYDFNPMWSPNGEEIVFSSKNQDNWNIFLMTTNGTDVRQLTFNNISANPCWSPDGQFLIFSLGSKNPYLKSEIHVMDANGNSRRVVIDWPGSDEGYPRWGNL